MRPLWGCVVVAVRRWCKHRRAALWKSVRVRFLLDPESYRVSRKDGVHIVDHHHSWRMDCRPSCVRMIRFAACAGHAGLREIGCFNLRAR
jgi:hypothetical protein